MGRKATIRKSSDEEAVPYEVDSAANGDVRVKMDGQRLQPARGFSHDPVQNEDRFRSLPRRNNHPSGYHCPAYFNDANVTPPRCGKIAGLEVLRIINEPTASRCIRTR